MRAHDHRIVVMGVSGAGKTSFGAALSARLEFSFVDGDALHSAASVAKMSAGVSLDDADRAPWLDRVGDVLAGGKIVVTCSALKRSYRDRLRTRSGGCSFIYLALPRDVARERVAGRGGHFMPRALVDDQFATLELPAADETDVLTLDARLPVGHLVAAAVSA